MLSPKDQALPHLAPAHLSIFLPCHSPPRSLHSSHSCLLPGLLHAMFLLPQDLCTCCSFCLDALPPYSHLIFTPPPGFNISITLSGKPPPNPRLLAPPLHRTACFHLQSSCTRVIMCIMLTPPHQCLKTKDHIGLVYCGTTVLAHSRGLENV